ncbi:hypothetical protein, partial [Thaumasiovibrio sp. DFM-14]|uniref:hypothetical protein n=1 Tax=Thaumasiovibrio sp. DFM-14 TaxID=3384792 RepID=UPI0039A24792
NLLINSDFSHSDGWQMGQNEAWAKLISPYYNDSPNSCVIGRSNAVPVPFGWCAEVNTASGNARISSQTMTMGGEVDDSDERSQCAFLFNGYDTDVVMYQPFNAPTISTVGISPMKMAAYSAYFRGFAKNTVSRFGVMELDDDDRFVKIVAEMPIQEEDFTTGQRFIHHYLHGISLVPGGRYAYFYETKDLSGFSCSCNETGIYLNPDKEDVTPSLDSPHNLYPHGGLLGHYPAAELIAGKSVPVPMRPMVRNVDRHLIMTNVSDGKRPPAPADGSIEVNCDGAMLSIVANGVSNTVEIRYHWSLHPMKCGFYDA